MNGYLRAVQRIASTHPQPDSTDADRDMRLLQWIRSMSHLNPSAKRIGDAPLAAENIATLRSSSAPLDRRAIAGRDNDPDHSAIDAAVSFILNVLFDGNRSKAEIRIARAMFRPAANIVLIPRDRPSLACAVGIDEFFAADKEMLKYEERWEEAWRIHDPCADGPARMRIRAQIVLDPNRDISKPRSTEVVFALRNATNAQRIHSCTIVYDETPRGSSPVTLFA